MASLLIKADLLSEGDIMLLPFGRTATISQIKPRGPRARFIQVKTEYGWTRLETSDEVHVQVGVR